MNQVNPKYVLRNYLAQLAIDSAEQGDLSMLYDLEKMLKNPYDDQPEFDKWFAKRPDWAKDRAGCSMLSCSSWTQSAQLGSFWEAKYSLTDDILLYL